MILAWACQSEWGNKPGRSQRPPYFTTARVLMRSPLYSVYVLQGEHPGKGTSFCTANSALFLGRSTIYALSHQTCQPCLQPGCGHGHALGWLVAVRDAHIPCVAVFGGDMLDTSSGGWVCGEVEQRVCKHVWQPDAANQLDMPSKGQGSLKQRRGLGEWQSRCVRQQRSAVGSPAQGTVVHQTQCSLPHRGAPLPPTNERSAPFPSDRATLTAFFYEHCERNGA